MFRKIVISVVALSAVTLGAVPAGAELGGSDTRSCVTKREYRAVKVGMSKTRVHRIFDSKGQLRSRDNGFEFRDYRPCDGFLDYMLRYQDGRLHGKLS